MNTFWIQDGKKLTLLSTVVIAICTIGIFYTENTIESAFFGMMIPVFGIIAVKASLGWSYVRHCEKQRKKRNFQLQ